jgi:nucleoside-diphosphate-sugar epimerase
MRVFLSGATGYIGSAVLEALVRAGHEVTALVRDDVAAARLDGPGIRPIVGNLERPASYRAAAAGHDAYVLCAFEPTARGVDVEPREPATEECGLDPAEHVRWRPDHERLVLDAAGPRLRTAVIRPGIVYGGSRGIVGDLFRDAANGLMRVIGTGENHWPLVYDRDLADLYVRVVERPDAAGVFHANDEGDERVNDVVEAIRSHMPVAPDVRHVPLAEARAKYGPVADALALDQVLRSPRARALGWTPALRSVAGNVPRLLAEWRAGQAGS